MVIAAAPFAIAPALVAVEESAEPLLERLDPPKRAAMLMAMLALVLVGLALVTCIMIGGRWVRRIARQRHGQTTHTSHVENLRVRSALEPILPSAGTDETTIIKHQSDDTVADRSSDDL